MSGFDLIRSGRARRSVAHPLSGQGLQDPPRHLGLDAAARLRFAEVPTFHPRRPHGESKLDSLVAWDFGMLMPDKRIRKFIPVRFLAFTLVGGAGVLVHMSSSPRCCLTVDGFLNTAQGVATVVATGSNFGSTTCSTYC